MSSFEIKSGEIVHCVEAKSAGLISGNFKFDQERIRTSLFSYNNAFNLSQDAEIFLITEKGLFVSLHHNVYVIRDIIAVSLDQRGRIYKQELISNAAVIGYNEWNGLDLVRRVNFKVDHTTLLMEHKEITEEIYKYGVDVKTKLQLYSEKVSGKKLEAGYGVQESFGSERKIAIVPNFSLEFDAGVTIDEYLSHVVCYVQFLSFCMGACLKPVDIRISRYTRSEASEMVKSQTYPGDHRVVYVWHENEIDTRDIWAGGSPVRAWDDSELLALRQCLVAWTDRHPDWQNAYAVMMESLSLKKEISANRLITACKWFEEIPIAKQQSTINKEHIDEIATAAAAKATELGYDSTIKRRISGSLKAIRNETHEERFSRLLDVINIRFGHPRLPDGMIGHLRRAIEFRGKVAHGHFNPIDQDEQRAFSKATRAMEALCYFLTALNLPISSDGLGRVRSNSVVQDYLRAYG